MEFSDNIVNLLLFPHLLSLTPLFGLLPLARTLKVAAVLICIPAMSLSCLVCHNMDSRSRSFRSYSVSSSEDEGRCSAVVTCLTRKVAIATAGTANAISTAKVTPFPMMASGQGMTGTPRLLRSRATKSLTAGDPDLDLASSVLDHKISGQDPSFGPPDLEF
ncbi:hypothetical protein OPV22_024686 [Ensete ventricosum]|uniref:Uncharacterized protein n=1 Tax=Ensete ventricosum TaxID=4639 RepID=A0AAV8QBK8_ENSVE|nr:hypothetical protein OPV22_024686 [Ensete ventricosum]